MRCICIILLLFNCQILFAQCIEEVDVFGPQETQRNDGYEFKAHNREEMSRWIEEYALAGVELMREGQPTFGMYMVIDTICRGDCANFSPYEPYYYSVPTTYHKWLFEGAEPNFSYDFKAENIYYPDAGCFDLFLVVEGLNSSLSTFKPFGLMIVEDCPPLADFTATSTILCAGQSTIFTDLSQKFPQNWQWFLEGADEPFANDTLVEARYSEEGVYDVQLIVSNSAGEDTLLLEDYMTVLPAPAAEFAGSWMDFGIDYGDVVELQACEEAEDFSYSWQPTVGLSCTDCPNPIANPLETTEYTLTLHQENVPCETKCFYRVEVVPSGILMPTAFSPNRDDINDFLKPVSSLAEVLQWTVYSRWGVKVFEGSGNNSAWNGAFEGSDAPIGSYVWIVEYLPKGASVPVLEKGFVVVVR